MPVLTVVANLVPDSVSLEHFCSAVEDEHSGFELAICLDAGGVEVALLDFELVPDSEGLLVFVACTLPWGILILSWSLVQLLPLVLLLPV